MMTGKDESAEWINGKLYRIVKEEEHWIVRSYVVFDTKYELREVVLSMPFDYLIELHKLIKIHNRTKKNRIRKKVIKNLEKFNFLW